MKSSYNDVHHGEQGVNRELAGCRMTARAEWFVRVVTGAGLTTHVQC